MSKSVNGNRGGLIGPTFTPAELLVVGFAWASLLGFAVFAVVGVIAVL